MRKLANLFSYGAKMFLYFQYDLVKSFKEPIEVRRLGDLVPKLLVTKENFKI